MARGGVGCNEEEGEGEEGLGHRPACLVSGVGGGEVSTSNGRHTQNFVDRTKVRILLCDGDPKSSRKVFELLSKCSYQVISVRTARQVINALNAQGSEIDILLSEVDLPIAKGLKMLKYIMRNKELRHIPVVMMSAKDEVSVVVKCLRLGAADYLVKPLRTNELLNLWTHMWRRRRMLGLTEKDILSHEFDLLVSDPSDGNTNGTLLSDDTDDRSKVLLLETGMSNLHELESQDSALEVEHDKLLECELNVLEGRDKSGKQSVFLGRSLSCPKKSELKVGESSAFFTYVKSSAQAKHFGRRGPPEVLLQPSSSKEKHLTPCKQLDEIDRHEGVLKRGDGDGFANSGHGNVNLLSEPSQPSPEWHLFKGQSSYSIQPQCGDVQTDASGVSTLFHMPYYFPGMMRQNVMHSCPSLYQGGFHDVQVQGSPVVLPQYNPLPQCTRVPIISPFPYCQVNAGMQPEQMPSPHLWPSMANSSTPEGKSGRIERREAALIKFRQKRKDRCFGKKIRYVNRKRLAERRPRVRGQFVRQSDGVNVDLNGYPAVDGDLGDEDDEDDEESVPTDVGFHSSPELDASEF